MKRNHSSGFAVSELIIVLAIITTCPAIAKPDITTIASGYILKTAAREVATDLQLTRLLAVKENKTFQVVFDSNCYQVIRLSDGTVTRSRSFAPEYPGLNLTNVSITFDSRGISDGNTVTVANERGVTQPAWETLRIFASGPFPP